MPRFQKEDRILNRAEYNVVKKQGVRFGSGALFASFLPAQKKCLGLVVGKKTGNAVVRNRIKRVLREHFRLNRDEYPMGKLVIVTRPAASNLLNEELRKSIENLLEKIK